MIQQFLFWGFVLKKVHGSIIAIAGLRGNATRLEFTQPRTAANCLRANVFPARYS